MMATGGRGSGWAGCSISNMGMCNGGDTVVGPIGSMLPSNGHNGYRWLMVFGRLQEGRREGKAASERLAMTKEEEAEVGLVAAACQRGPTLAAEASASR